MSLDVSLILDDDIECFTDNTTHNMRAMAQAVGIYVAIWRPEDAEIVHAKDLIAPLSTGLVELLANPERVKPLAPNNQFGTYATFVKFVSEYLSACKTHPEAKVRVCR